MSTGTSTVTAPSAIRAAWAVLTGAGTITMVYNIWHATHAGHMIIGLALLYGFGPVFVAALLSHIVAEYECGWFLKGIAFATMLGAMAMSIGATAWVLGPTAGPVLRWVFGAVLDTAALVSLRVILDSRKRQNAFTSDLEAARTAVAEAAQLERDLREQLAAKPAERLRLVYQRSDEDTAAIEAGERSAERAAQLEAELEAVQRKLAKAVQARSKQPAGTGTKTGTRKPGTAPASTGASTADADELTTELRALAEIEKDPTISGAELARRLNITDSYGRRLRRELAARDGAPDGR
jgi:hypothetical protein